MGVSILLTVKQPCILVETTLNSNVQQEFFLKLDALSNLIGFQTRNIAYCT